LGSPETDTSVDEHAGRVKKEKVRSTIVPPSPESADLNKKPSFKNIIQSNKSRNEVDASFRLETQSTEDEKHKKHSFSALPAAEPGQKTDETPSQERVGILNPDSDRIEHPTNVDIGNALSYVALPPAAPGPRTAVAKGGIIKPSEVVLVSSGKFASISARKDASDSVTKPDGNPTRDPNPVIPHPRPDRSGVVQQSPKETHLRKEGNIGPIVPGLARNSGRVNGGKIYCIW
jgi:hypothetical protein